MGALSSINIIFRTDLKSLSTGMQNSIREMNKYGDALQDVGKRMTSTVTLSVAGLGIAALKTYGDLDSLKRGLTSVEGSSEAASAEFENLRDVAKLPGLGLEEAARGSVNLQSASFSADLARRSLIAFGNALATVGKGAPELDRVNLALTQLNNKQSGFGQDIRQLMEQLPQLRGALVAAFGTADTEKISKMGVTGRQVVEALIVEFEKLPKVTGGFKNAVENATDSMKISLAGLGESINKTLNVEGKINSFADALSGLSERFQKLSPAWQSAIITGSAFAAALGPMAFGLGSVIKLLPIVTTGFTALSAAALPAVAIAGAITLALVAYSGRTAQLTKEQYAQIDAQNLSNKINADAAKLVVRQRVELDKLLVTARNLTEPMEKRRAAMDAINKISPEYLGNITLETVNTNQAITAINQYNEALLKGALARAARTKLDENASKRIEADVRFQQKNLEYQKLKAEAEAKGNDELEKFHKKNNGWMGWEYVMHEKKLESLDEEDRQILQIIKSNEKYADLVKEMNTLQGQGGNDSVKKDTIAYYEDQIKKLKELQTQFETTPQGVAVLEGRISALQKKIDNLRSVRKPVITIEAQVKADGLEMPKFESQGTTEAYDKQIEILRKLQTQVSTTSDAYYALEKAILGVELDKEIKFDFPVEDINNFSTTFRNFGQNFKLTSEEIQRKSTEMAAVAKGVSDGFASAFENMSGRFLDSLSAADDGLQGFFKGLSAVVLKIISTMLAQSIAQSIAGATAGAVATGPAAPFTQPAFIAEMVGGVLAAFAAIPKFETGGLIPGSSFSGDNMLIRANSGERVLTAEHQRWLESIAQPRSASSEVSVNLGGGFVVDGNQLRLVLDRTDKRNNRNR